MIKEVIVGKQIYKAVKSKSSSDLCVNCCFYNNKNCDCKMPKKIQEALPFDFCLEEDIHWRKKKVK